MAVLGIVVHFKRFLCLLDPLLYLSIGLEALMEPLGQSSCTNNAGVAVPVVPKPELTRRLGAAGDMSCSVITETLSYKLDSSCRILGENEVELRGRGIEDVQCPSSDSLNASSSDFGR